MPYEDPDPTDPMTLHGVAVDTDDSNATIEMASCFIEEYARMGFSADRLLRIFQNPGYAGPYLAYRLLGERRIVSLIQAQAELRTAVHRNNTEVVCVNSAGGIQLRVLN